MPLRLASLAKGLACAALISVAAAAVFFAVFAAATIWAPQDQQTIRQNLVEAITRATPSRATTGWA